MDYSPTAMPSNGTLSNTLTGLRACATISVVEDEEMSSSLCSFYQHPQTTVPHLALHNQAASPVMDDSTLILIYIAVSIYLQVQSHNSYYTYISLFSLLLYHSTSNIFFMQAHHGKYQMMCFGKYHDKYWMLCFDASTSW